ncbi:MAG: hypothetical protein WAU10_27195 [Caldilineaceae bacterium]
MQKRITLWVAMLMIAALALSGCAPRAGAGSSAAMAMDDELVIDLPAIVIDFASDGTASIGGIPAAEMGAIAGVDLSTLGIAPEWVDYFSMTNIQHLQIDNTAGGLLILVNGQPIPSLEWDTNSLIATAGAVESLGIAVPVLDKVLPLVQQLGIGAILRFPVQAGAEVIPFSVMGDGSAAEMAKAAQDEFLAAVGSPPKINLPIVYQTDGSYSVGDLSDADWTALTGVPWNALRLDPSVISGLTGSGITSMALETDQAGIHVSINGNELPYIGWGNGEVQHVLNLADQMGVWDAYLPGMNMDDMMSTIDALPPVVQTTNANISVYLPGSGMGN